jgi:hypothetical protein
MTVRSCRVTIANLDGISHTVEVTEHTVKSPGAHGFLG